MVAVCYEGLDVNTALYEWNFPRQMLHIKIAEAATNATAEQIEHELFNTDYLIKRPLLQAIREWHDATHGAAHR